MAYSRSFLGGSDEDYSRSVLGGSDEYFRRTLLGGSDDVQEIHCEPCKKDGKTADAVKHCLDCSEYLCAQCFKSHTRFKAFQNHLTNNVVTANPIIIKNSTETINKSADALSELHIHHTNEQQNTRPTNSKSSKKPNRQVKAEFLSSMEVRTSRDKQTPHIRDLTIVHTYYCIVTDDNNMSVKVVDTRKKCVISEVQFSEAQILRCITSVNDGEVAVTVTVQHVWRLLFLIVSKSGIISNTGRAFDIDSGYNGIIYHIDHFYASYIGSISKFTMNGQIIKAMNNSAFFRLDTIALSNDHNTIYVYSSTAESVFSVDLEGNIKATYKDEDLKKPMGVTVDSKGYVYVCSTQSDTRCVHQLTAELNKVQVIISGDYVTRCTFNRVENRLFVTFRNQIKIYDLK